MVFVGIAAFIVTWDIYGRRDNGGQRRDRTVRSILVALFAVYTYFIIAVTLINRSVTADSEAQFIPLWSWYQVIVNHSLVFLEEIILNIILFIPFGVLLKLTTNISVWKAFLVGFGFSLTIELSEYVLCRGLFEWGDVLHNSIGCVIGAAIAKLFMRTRGHGSV